MGVVGGQVAETIWTNFCYPIMRSQSHYEIWIPLTLVISSTHNISSPGSTCGPTVLCNICRWLNGMTIVVFVAMVTMKIACWFDIHFHEMMTRNL